MDAAERTADRRGLVVAAFPKSASSHLIALIGKAVMQARVVRAKTCQGFGHNLLNAGAIPVDPNSHVIVYGHAPACAHNLKAIQGRMIRPSCVVVVRNLPDVVVSFADHIHRDRRSPLDFDTPGLVDGFLGTTECSRSELYDLVIDYTLPWYVRFLCSWLHGSHGIPVTVSTFEEHTAFPAALLRHLVAFGELESRPEIIKSLADGEGLERINFNRGVSGRGASELAPRQLRRVEELVCGVRGLRGTRLGTYLVGGYPAVGRSPSDILAHKMNRGASTEWFLEDQPIAGAGICGRIGWPRVEAA